MNIKLLRLTAPDKPQLGLLYLAQDIRLYTLELPKLSIPSCIPDGNYSCHKTTNRITHGGMHIPVTYEVTNAPSRSGILFHIGNVPADTMGCILVGAGLGVIGNQVAITDSRIGFDKFIRFLNGVEQFDLTIEHL